MITFEVKAGSISNIFEINKMLLSLKDGRYRIEPKAVNTRSTDANEYYWVICELLVIPLRELGWDFRSKDDVHEFLKFTFLAYRIKNSKGVSVWKIPSTSKLSVSEFNEYIRSIEIFCAEQQFTEVLKAIHERTQTTRATSQK